MRHHFRVPPELREAWELLTTRYVDYLPEIVMNSDSFVALPADAIAIYSELAELSLCRRKKRLELQARAAGM